MWNYWVKYSKYTLYVILAIVAVFAGIVYFATLADQSGRPVPQELSFAGEYLASSGESGKITSDFNVSAASEDSVTLTGHFSRDVAEGEQISFHIEYLNVNIWKNSEKVYSYRQGGDGHFKYSSIIWGLLESDGISTSDDIVIELESPYLLNYPSAYKHFLTNMYIGDRSTLFFWLVRNSWVGLIAGLLIASMGLFLTIFILATRLTSFRMYRGAVYSSLFMLVVGLWSMLNFRYMPLFMLPTGFMSILESCLIFSEVPLLVMYLYCISKTVGGRLLHIVEATSSLYLIFFLIQTMMGVLDNFTCRTIFLVLAFCWSMLCIIASVFELGVAKTKVQKFTWGTGIITVMCSMAEIMNIRMDLFPRDSLLKLSFYIFAVVQMVISINFIRNSINQARRVADLKKEKMESQMSIMVSQIQPHFLYNSLTVIQQLCDIDSQKAKEAVNYFARYLRGNMDSINQMGPIPFEKEIKHVDNYLALEKMRFDDINIEYDILTTDFMLPALSVQPIVENAVRYGVSKNPEGGKITISTHEDDKCYYVTITDDGPGFDTKLLQEEAMVADTDITKASHIGIANVRNRLYLMCNGSLTIKSIINEGTEVVLRIPKGDN